MLDSLKNKIEELGGGCLLAILFVVLFYSTIALIGAAFHWWYITLSIVFALGIIGYLYSKYKVQIKHKWNTLNKSKLTYPIISILLLGCLCKMPYEYYTLVRLFTMGMFAYWAYTYYQKKEEKLTFVFGTLALLFQPFEKVGLSRDTWNLLDVVIAIFILILWYKKEAFTKTEDNTNNSNNSKG